MTTPDVPLRLEMTFEVAGTPEQVWDAIATGKGITSWFMPTDVDERQGGSIVTHMGPDADSRGRVTGWEPARRFAYEEPEWAALMGHEGEPVTPLATEFLIEARSGGTCVLRVTSSAFGTGADWERELFEEMEKGWRPYFEHLKLYLDHFPGQVATPMEVQAPVAGTALQAAAALRTALGAREAGQKVETRGVTAVVKRVGDRHVVLRLAEPVPGILACSAFEPPGESQTLAAVQAYLFSAGAPAYAEREAPAWQAWLEDLVVPAG